MGYPLPESVIIGRIERAFPSDELRERVRATNRPTLTSLKH